MWEAETQGLSVPWSAGLIHLGSSLPCHPFPKAAKAEPSGSGEAGRGLGWGAGARLAGGAH